MIHVGQQSAFPKLKFIANRAKLEHLIQQGRRQYRPRGLRDGDIQNVLSEDDLQGLLKRTKSNGPREEATYPLSGSESSSSAGFSRPGSPITLPLGFTFTRKNKKGLAELNTSAKSSTQTPDSPSLSKRLTGWWNTKSPRGTQPSTPKDPSRSRSPYTHHDRPNSMFELRPPKEVRELQAKSHARPEPRHSDFLEEIRRRSSAFVEGGQSDDDGAFEKVSRRAKQHDGGAFGDVDAGADDAEDYGEAGDFGDDEGDEDEVQNVGDGLS
jgi:hypothetical protein